LDQRPDERTSTPHDWKVSVQDHDDDHRHDQPLALGQVRDFRCRANGHRRAPAHPLQLEACGRRRGPDARGCFHEGLHEGVRQGLPEGIRPASDPSPDAITPGHGGGGGSTAWADLRGEW
jgi:hypothetical protein